ncbi:GAF domain-containing protein [Spirillospora sp. NPDC048823]|uniref:GAF domain-containing protein n=1 Tax=unclassified Spirillospora TaxID=2642701 RepID=UPI003717673E
MRYDADSGLEIPIWHDTVQERLRLLAEFGLDGIPDAEFDGFAAHVSGTFASELGAAGQGLYAMVNLFMREEQTFIGLHNPPGARAVARTMAPDHGFCPEMLDRTKALVLADVCAKPQFASNPVVDKLGVRTYAGAPLVHEGTGTVLGSVCVVGASPLPKATRQTSLVLIKRHRDALVELLGQRTRRRGGRHGTGYQDG